VDGIKVSSSSHALITGELRVNCPSVTSLMTASSSPPPPPMAQTPAATTLPLGPAVKAATATRPQRTAAAVAPG
jgi:hypothetical protein